MADDEDALLEAQLAADMASSPAASRPASAAREAAAAAPRPGAAPPGAPSAWAAYLAEVEWATAHAAGVAQKLTTSLASELLRSEPATAGEGEAGGAAAPHGLSRRELAVAAAAIASSATADFPAEALQARLRQTLPGRRCGPPAAPWPAASAATCGPPRAAP